MRYDVEKIRDNIIKFAKMQKERMERLTSTSDDRTFHLIWGLTRREKDNEISGSTIVIDGVVERIINTREVKNSKNEWMTYGPRITYREWVKRVNSFKVGTVVELREVEEDDQSQVWWRYTKVADNQWSAVDMMIKHNSGRFQSSVVFHTYQGIREDIAANMGYAINPDYQQAFNLAAQLIISEMREETMNRINEARARVA